MIPGGLNSFLYANKIAINVVLSGSESDVNLATKATAAGWDGVTPITLNVTINGGVEITASSVSTFALDETGLVSGTVVNIDNNGSILGKGGAGGTRGVNAGNATNGQDGGDALKITVPTNIDNEGGTINAGDGGNGGSSANRTVTPANALFCCGSFLTANFNCGASDQGSNGAAGGRNGQNGSAGAQGSGALAQKNGNCVACGVVYSGPNSSCNSGSPGSGGSAGNYVNGNSLVNWVNNGTRNGNVV